MEELEITEEMRQKYCNEDPNHCPFCGSDNISGGPIDGYDICATRNIKCNDCEAEWTEQFELLEINNAFRDK